MVRIFCTAVDDNMAEYLDRLAKELNITRSELIRQILRNIYISRKEIMKEEDTIYLETLIVIMGKRRRK